ncbi:protein Frey 1 isoform X1 [Kogia breviceps]|uniref:protein Frey 1 isoform X1 n=1 Tax=Kogia breviceps TaxID=27615 RepID=UPI002795FB35|nr:protein Frey 1 isoform X1 [Kogia breviceps]
MVLAVPGAPYPRAAPNRLILNLILLAALLRPQLLRPQPSVLEEFSAPLELSEPLSGPVDGNISSFPYPFPSSAPSPPWWGRDALGEGTQVQPEGLLSQRASAWRRLQWTQNRFSLPLTPSSLSLDYGVRPKHPGPRGPRPLLSRAQQRKRDGPDVAEYSYDAHL